MKRVLQAATASLCLALALPAQAEVFSVRLGAHNVDPKSNNGQLAGLDANVSSETNATLGVSWNVTPNLSTDLWVGLDGFRHDVSLAGAGAAFGVGTDTVASVRHRPLTLGVNYHFGDGAFRPFIGAGYGWISVGASAASARWRARRCPHRAPTASPGRSARTFSSATTSSCARTPAAWTSTPT